MDTLLLKSENYLARELREKENIATPIINIAQV